VSDLQCVGSFLAQKRINFQLPFQLPHQLPPLKRRGKKSLEGDGKVRSFDIKSGKLLIFTPISREPVFCIAWLLFVRYDDSSGDFSQWHATHAKIRRSCKDTHRSNSAKDSQRHEWQGEWSSSASFFCFYTKRLEPNISIVSFPTTRHYIRRKFSAAVNSATSRVRGRHFGATSSY
jgi:hypothetical protein